MHTITHTHTHSHTHTHMHAHAHTCTHTHAQKLDSAPVVTAEILEMKQHKVAERKKQVDIYTLTLRLALYYGCNLWSNRHLTFLIFLSLPFLLLFLPPPLSFSSCQELEKRLAQSRMSRKDRLRKEIQAAREMQNSEVSIQFLLI